MKSLLNRYATPVTTGLFAVSGISGIALFFHLTPAAFHGMHEWLSMVLLIPFALHIWKNWAALVGYVRRRTLMIPLALCLVAALPFAIPAMIGEGSGGNPAFKTIALLTETPLKNLSPILKTTPEKLITGLAQQGYDVRSSDITLAAVAASAGEDPNALLFALIAQR